MKRLAIVLALAALAGCASNERIFGAGESFCTSSDPKVCAALFASMAPLHTPEMNATLKRAQCQAQKELCK